MNKDNTYERFIKEFKKLLEDRERSASGERRCADLEPSSLILSIEIPEKSPIQDGSQVSKSRNNFHLLVDNTGGEFRRKSKTVCLVLHYKF